MTSALGWKGVIAIAVAIPDPPLLVMNKQLALLTACAIAGYIYSFALRWRNFGRFLCACGLNCPPIFMGHDVLILLGQGWPP